MYMDPPITRGVVIPNFAFGLLATAYVDYGTTDDWTVTWYADGSPLEDYISSGITELSSYYEPIFVEGLV